MRSHSVVRSLALLGVAASLSASALSQELFVFSKERPKLVVLLHGVTVSKANGTKEGVATSRHARYYWGMGMIQGLMGNIAEDYSSRVITPRSTGTFTFKTTPFFDWHEDKHVAHSSDLAPIVYPISWFTNLPKGIETNQTLIRDYIRIMTRSGPHAPTMVMIASRDGSKHLMPQTGDAIDQIFTSYQMTFGGLAPENQPQIYFLAHSFGGNVARCILSNPTEADLFGNKLTPLQRERAEFLRMRTMSLTTLSSPHNGTPMGDVAEDLANWVLKNGGVVETVLASVDVLTNTPPLNVLGLGTDLVGGARKAFKELIATGKRACLQDLTRAAEYNTGILSADRARRGERGWRIPIYTLSGRNPGGEFYDRNRAPFALSSQWRPITVANLLGGSAPMIWGDERPAFEAAMLHLTNALMHQEGYGREAKRPWGSATVPEADRMRSAYAGFGASSARPLTAPITLLPGVMALAIVETAKGRPYTWGRDGENDSDGFLGVDSGHGQGIIGGAWYRTWSQRYGTVMPWDNDNHGSGCFNWGTGAWIQNEIIRKSGPFQIAENGALSDWLFEPTPALGTHNVKLEVLEVHDVHGNIDYNGADFTLYVKIMEQNWTTFGPNNTRTWKNAGTYTMGEIPSSVIPIKVSVVERDNPPLDPHDMCIVGYGHRDVLYLYFDTRTGRVFSHVGGAMGFAGDILESSGAGNANSVRLKFRITGS